jgi:hypothetical protein
MVHGSDWSKANSNCRILNVSDPVQKEPAIAPAFEKLDRLKLCIFAGKYPGNKIQKNF